MAIIGTTHEFGPWGPVRFLLLPEVLQEGDRPAFYVTTSRMCRGIHDWRCTMAETQTFGPLVSRDRTMHELNRCDNCGAIQPPAEPLSTAEEPVCLVCSDNATVQHTAEDPDTMAAVTAAAALYAASGTLRHVQDADPEAYLTLLDETGEPLRALFDDAAWAVKQDPRRAKQTGYRQLALIARQVTANARDYAALHTDPLPVTENDES
jgi:hypothetical protein